MAYPYPTIIRKHSVLDKIPAFLSSTASKMDKNGDFRGGWREWSYKSQASDFQSQASDFQSQALDFQSQASDFQSQALAEAGAEGEEEGGDGARLGGRCGGRRNVLKNKLKNFVRIILFFKHLALPLLPQFFKTKYYDTD